MRILFIFENDAPFQIRYSLLNILARTSEYIIYNLEFNIIYFISGLLLLDAHNDNTIF